MGRANRRRWLVVWVAAAFLGGGLAACGGSGSAGGADTGGGEAPSSPDWDAPSTAVLRPGVVGLPGDGSTAAVDLTADGLRLTGTPPALQPGQVLVLPDGESPLRSVVSTAALPDGSLRVQTTAAHLEDVVQSGALRIHRHLTQEDLGQPVLAEGVTLTDAPAGSRGIHQSFDYQFQRTRIGSPVMVEVSGVVHVTLDTVNDFIFDANGDFQEAIFEVRAHATADLNVTAKARFQLLNETIPYAVYPGMRLPVPGYPLLWYIPEMALALNVTGQGEVGVTVLPSATFNAVAGVRFGRDTNFTAQPYGSLDLTGALGADQPNFWAQFKLTVVPAQTIFTCKLMGLAGPTMKLNAPSLEASWNESYDLSNPRSDVVLRSASKLVVGAGAGVLGTVVSSLVRVPAFEITAFEEYREIARKTFQPGSVETTVNRAGGAQ